MLACCVLKSAGTYTLVNFLGLWFSHVKFVDKIVLLQAIRLVIKHVSYVNIYKFTCSQNTQCCEKNVCLKSKFISYARSHVLNQPGGTIFTTMTLDMQTGFH